MSSSYSPFWYLLISCIIFSLYYYIHYLHLNIINNDTVFLVMSFIDGFCIILCFVISIILLATSNSSSNSIPSEKVEEYNNNINYVESITGENDIDILSISRFAHLFMGSFCLVFSSFFAFNFFLLHFGSKLIFHDKKSVLICIKRGRI